MNPMFFLALLQGYQSYQSSQQTMAGLASQQTYRNKIIDLNNRIAEYKIKDVTKQGEEDVAKIRRAKATIRGSQRLSLATQGLDISSGSAADIIAESEKEADLDIITTQNNAAKSAWGIKVDTEAANLEGRMQDVATAQAQRNTLLTQQTELIGTGLQAWYYGKKG